VDDVSARLRHRGIAGAVFTALVLVFLLVPLIIVALFSLHSSPSLTFPFQGFSTRWYSEVFGSEDFRESLFNSLKLALATALFTLIFGTAAAYGVTRSGSRMSGVGVAIFMLPITLPLLFVGIALLIALRRAGFELSLLTILIGHTIIAFPFFFMIARVALERLDPMLEEAAADLGASPWTAFRKVTLPQVLPVLLGAAALAFMVSLDEFIVTFFLSGNETTLPLFIFSRLRTTLNPSINVVSTLLMAITLALFVFAFVMGIRAERKRSRRAAALLDQVG
jgi:ABC-type spermidine/putrescine transport system permease subunit II